MPVKSLFPDIKTVEAPSLVDFLLSDAAKSDPSATYLIDSDTGERHTLGRLRNDVDQISRALHAIGIRRGDVVAVCLPNCMEYMSILLATISRGAAYCEEYEYHLADCTAKVVFASPESIQNVWVAVRKLGNNQKVILIEHQTSTECPTGALKYKEFLSASTSVGSLPTVSINPKTDTACMLYSSGTTGKPKAVMLSHAALTISLQLLFEPTLYDYPKKGEHAIGMLPMFHIMGLILCLNCIKRGSILVVMRKYEAEKLLLLIEKYKVPVLYCVPPIMVSLAKDPLVDQYDLTSLRTIVAGAAPLGKELHEEVMARLPKLKILCQAYGMTEVGTGSMYTPKWKTKPGSCGMLVPNFACKVINIDTGKECGPHEPGEIWLQGPTFMLGYYRKPTATAETIDPDGWLHTGDIGYYDEEGFFFIVDRLKELIKVKAFQVSPAELEDLLISHPAVDDAAVIAKPDPVAGEVPKAIVVKKPTARVTEKELIQFVEEHVASYKRLKGGVQFVDAIPKSPSGKILRRLLKQQERERGAESSKL